MWIYTIINTSITSMISLPLYYFQKLNYYKEIDKMKDDIEICLKEIESLHKHRMEHEEHFDNIIPTIRFTGTEWQKKVMDKKYKHYGDNDLE